MVVVEKKFIVPIRLVVGKKTVRNIFLLFFCLDRGL